MVAKLFSREHGNRDYEQKQNEKQQQQQQQHTTPKAVNK